MESLIINMIIRQIKPAFVPMWYVPLHSWLSLFSSLIATHVLSHAIPFIQPDNDDDDDHGADAGNAGEMLDDEDMFQNQDVHTEMEGQEIEIGAFTGDNLIAPPNKVRALSMRLKCLCQGDM